MANPLSPLNAQAETLDYVIGDDGIARLKRSVGTHTPTGAATASANHAVVTHLAGSPIGATDELVAAGAKDPSGNAQPAHVDAAGNLLDASTLVAYVATPTGVTLAQVTGTLAAATYYYRVTATTSAGETVPSTEVSLAITATHGVAISWPQVAGATGYKVYGRSTGAELLMATITNGTTLTWTDSGSITPSGAMPTVNTATIVVTVAGTLTTTPPANASTNLTQVGGVAIAEGQALMAASLPVAIASNQSAIPIAAASLPLPAGAATSANQPPLGAALSAASLPVVLATDGVTIGALLETAPISDTASSGLNGRLQRIAQRLTSIIALLPTALGGGGGLKVEGTGTPGTPAGGVATVQGGVTGGDIATQPLLPVAALGEAYIGSGWSAARAAAIYKSVVASASGSTAVWTPFGGTVTVGANPLGVAVTPNGAYAYVANNDPGTVSVIATATNTVVATVTVGVNPYGVAVTPNGAYAYVANYGPGTVSVIATATNTVVARRFRLLRFMLVLTDEAARAVAGDLTVALLDGASDMGISLPVYVPAAAIAAPLGEAWSSGWIDLGSYGYPSLANGNVLNVNLSNALTAGKFGIIVAGTEET